MTMTPLIMIASSEEDKMEAMKLLGYDSAILFLNAITSRSNVRDAFRVALLLVSMKEHSEELSQFFGKIEFKDRDIERKWKEHFNIVDDPDCLSVGQLYSNFVNPKMELPKQVCVCSSSCARCPSILF